MKLINILNILIVYFASADDSEKNYVKYDWSFEIFCTRFKGEYTKRTEPRSEIGDRCIVGVQKNEWALKGANKKVLSDFCKYWFPYTLIDVKDDNDQVMRCVLENPHMCQAGWAYIDKMCYKLMDFDQHFTYAETEKRCKAFNSRVLTARPMINIWIPKFYPSLSQIWIQDHKDPDMIIEEANMTESAVILAYGTSVGLTGYGKTARINKNKYSQAFCEYEAPGTAASLRLLQERMAKILPFKYVNGKIFLPSRNRHGKYPISQKKNGKHQQVYEELCKPFNVFFSMGNSDFVSFVPYLVDADRVVGEVLEKSPYRLAVDASQGRPSLKDRKMNRDCVVINERLEERQKLFEGEGAQAKETDNIQKYNYADFKISKIWESDFPHISCDIMTSAVASKNDGGKLKIFDVSDAYRAPVLCAAGLYDRAEKNKFCRPGDNTFDRLSGQRVCFFIMPEEGLSWDEFDYKCTNTYEGVGLAGFESEAEYQAMDSLRYFTVDNEKKRYNVYLGGQRRDECKRTFGGKGYDASSIDAPCSRRNAFDWKNRVAMNTKENLDIIAKHWDRSIDQEPNNLGTVENCLEFKENLNDIPCGQGGRKALCQREPIFEKSQSPQ